MRRFFFLLLAVPALHAATFFVTVAGLGGTAEYETQFAKWAADLDRELKTNGPTVHVTTLSGSASTKQGLEASLSRMAADMKPEDAFVLTLIGHGSFDETEYKFNLPGPDISTAELAALLNRVPARRQLVVNMSSCSGASLAGLAKKERIVVTATKSGTEKNAPIFARYWIDALHDPAADADKNGTVSALEAYRYAEHKASEYFDSQKLLATEHSMITDTGTANAVRDPKPENGQGLLAASFPLMRPPVDGSKTVTPEKQKLFAKKEDLETRIDRLKYQKAAMAEEDYKQQLGMLLLELARTQAEIDR